MLNVIVTATGFKVGSKGKVINNAEKAKALFETTSPATFFGSMPKGNARKLRKKLWNMNLASIAAIPAMRAA